MLCRCMVFDTRLPLDIEKGILRAFISLFGCFVSDSIMPFPSTLCVKLKQQICISAEPWRSSKLTQVLKLTPGHFRRVVSGPMPPRSRHFRSLCLCVSVAWNERAGPLAAGDVASVWTLWVQSIHGARHLPGIFLWMRPANGRRRYIVTSSLIGWAHTQNDPWGSRLLCVLYAFPRARSSKLKQICICLYSLVPVLYC